MIQTIPTIKFSDSGACFTQYCHKIMSEIKRADDGFSIDMRWMDKVPARLARNPVYLKTDMPEGTGLDIFGAIPQPQPEACGKAIPQAYGFRAGKKNLNKAAQNNIENTGTGNQE
ncbi:MAG: hypothetical protein A2277_16865 [Desulfobacterales bacterium RIFOXYA12_FULL_46_15]|nr:MAG: hypothetical protein A2277_16865 [Desulfobacterales bacterium RIFOXYA12_FULL_46_15]